MLPRMDPREEQRTWLAQVLAHTGMAPTAIAIKAGLAPTTLTRFVNNPGHATALSARTIASIERISGLRYGATAPQRGLSEAEATAWESSGASGQMAEQISKLAIASNSVSVWQLKSRALETIGYMPGDILMVDLNEPPKRGDIVCAQLYDWHRMKAETVFRLYEPPYLLAASADRAMLQPRLIDHSIAVKGPVILSIRPRHQEA
ncbi:MAG: hypothetical protein KGQ37_03675 [Hyphomicrobiales bacterium]|nr:hypothetical protein [Hyphomicrobiales bacterium]